MKELRAQYSVILHAVNTLNQEGVTLDAGYPTLRHLLKDLFRIDTAQAREIVEHAELLHSRTEFSGAEILAA